MNIESFLKMIVLKDASDLYITADALPAMKVNGKLVSIGSTPLKNEMIWEMVQDITEPSQQAEFKETPELNLAIEDPNIGRFRVNVFRQRGLVAMVIRVIKTEIPDFKSLGLPEVVPSLVMKKHGLVLFVGSTGSGKSTSLASLIDHRNRNSAGHIITIEDPIEFTHSHKKSIVNQREVGVDTASYDDALQNTLRQAPDVILIGEIRSREVMEHALAFAETGHLCLSTLHANNANQALDRIINFFPEDRHSQLLMDLSLNLRGIVSQRLVPTVDNKRCAAIEVLLGTPRVQDLIKAGEVEEIKAVMEKSALSGMQTFDMALYDLLQAGKITEEDAFKNADSENNLKIRLKQNKGFEATSDFELKPDLVEEDVVETLDVQEDNGMRFSV